jgi:dTMP kinase
VNAGRLITIEGLDGVGKTTLVGALEECLRAAGVEEVKTLREPGGVRFSERLRELVKDPEIDLDARAEALAYAAARAQLVEQLVLPLLQAGTWVLLDRFVDSSLAYQGAGRELGFQAIRAINQFATGGLLADRTLLLWAHAKTLRQRQDDRGERPDRFESEDERFFTRVADAYSQLAREEPQRIRVLDAEQTPAEVLRLALEALGDLLPVGGDAPQASH